MVPVAEVEASHVHPRVQQLRQTLLAPAGGAQGAHNLRLAHQVAGVILSGGIVAECGVQDSLCAPRNTWVEQQPLPPQVKVRRDYLHSVHACCTVQALVGANSADSMGRRYVVKVSGAGGSA